MTWRMRAMVGLAVLLTAVTARAERWIVDTSEAQVVFTSKAPLETFKGRTDRLGGWLEFDPANLVGSVTGELAVDLASFDTGKKKRNQHMREKHFETGQFPTARLLPEAVLSASFADLPPAGDVSLSLWATLDLHGVQQPLTCDVELSRREDGSIEVTASFPVLLSDHGIKRPRFLVMKLADEQRVAVRFVMRPEAGP